MKLAAVGKVAGGRQCGGTSSQAERKGGNYPPGEKTVHLFCDLSWLERDLSGWKWPRSYGNELSKLP